MIVYFTDVPKFTVHLPQAKDVSRTSLYVNTDTFLMLR